MKRSPLRLLLVDDSADDAALIAWAFTRAGFSPICERVHTPEALAAALEDRLGWDVLMCDSVMPRLDLERVLSMVHHTKPVLPVVVVTGRRAVELRDVLARDDVDGFVSKDQLADLPAIVTGLLHTRSHLPWLTTATAADTLGTAR